MSRTPEFAYDELRKNRALIEAAGGSNEATTRMRAIDTILYNVLGWDRAICTEETYCRAVGFTDYALKDNGFVTH